jgi:glycosyltransferase involved in cell wall biosynthesis
VATIDILLPVKNGMPYLQESIESIITQRFVDWRLLVLDHGSSDGSPELAHRYAERDKRIEVHSVAGADNLGDLLNYGLLKCDCRYVARQDADDISLPSRLELTFDLFGHRPDLLLVGGDAIAIDASGRACGYIEYPHSSQAIACANFFYNPFAHPTIAINFAAAMRLNAFYGEDIIKALPTSESPREMTLAQDYFLFGQLAALGPCFNIKVPLIKYRVHQYSSSVASREQQTQRALAVSRFLAKSFCAMHGVPSFDPAPFCTIGENVFDCGSKNYASQFQGMALTLRSGLGISAELERELAFRWILADRNTSGMIFRYLKFGLRYEVQMQEFRIVRNWALRGMRTKYIYKVSGGVSR